MRDRKLMICEDGDMSVTCSVPQRSVLGLTLWNIFYDGILRIPTRKGVKLVAFADDVAVEAVAHDTGLVEQLVNPTLEDIVAWMNNKGLQLAPDKAECVVLSTKHSFRTSEVFIQGQLIPPKRAIRYLGTAGHQTHVHRAREHCGGRGEKGCNRTRQTYAKHRRPSSGKKAVTHERGP